MLIFYVQKCFSLFLAKVLGFFLQFLLKELKKYLKMMLWPCRHQLDQSWQAWLVWKVISWPSKPQLCFSVFLKHLLRCWQSLLNPCCHGICVGVCCWWPCRGSCRTPRSNETVTGFSLYCMCSCAWHSRIIMNRKTLHWFVNKVLRLDVCGSNSWLRTEFYDQPPSLFLLTFSGSLVR